MTRLAVLLVVAAACGGGPAKSVANPTPTGAGDAVADPIPHTAGPDCTVVADKLATVALAETPERQARARDVFLTHCVDDKWGDEPRSCLATVETDAEIHGCMTKLTPGQRDKLHAAAPDLASAHAPAAASPPPPPPPPSGSKTSGSKTSGSKTSGGKASGSGPAPGGGVDGTRAPKRTSADPCEGGE